MPRPQQLSAATQNTSPSSLALGVDPSSHPLVARRSQQHPEAGCLMSSGSSMTLPSPKKSGSGSLGGSPQQRNTAASCAGHMKAVVGFVLLILVVVVIFVATDDSSPSKSNPSSLSSQHAGRAVRGEVMASAVTTRRANEGAVISSSSSSVDALFTPPKSIGAWVRESSRRGDSKHNRAPVNEELIVICIGDSITFGNGTHDTPRKNSRSGSGEGSYPRELKALLEAHMGLAGGKEEGGERNEGDAARDAVPSPPRPSLLVYNFGISGVTATRTSKLAFERQKGEFSGIIKLIKDALAVGERSGAASSSSPPPTLLSSSSSYSSSELLFSAAEVLKRNPKYLVGPPVVHRETHNVGGGGGGGGRSRRGEGPVEGKSRRRTHRKVLILFKLGTNDSKKSLWTTTDNFISNYTFLVHSLLRPGVSGALAETRHSSNDDAVSSYRGGGVGDDLVDLSIVFLSPIPATPRPMSPKQKKMNAKVIGSGGGGDGGVITSSVLGNIQGFVIATAVRHGVMETAAWAQQWMRHQLSGGGVGFSDPPVLGESSASSSILPRQPSFRASVHFYDLWSDFLAFLESQPKGNTNKNGAAEKNATFKRISFRAELPLPTRRDFDVVEADARKDARQGDELASPSSLSMRHFSLPTISSDLFPEGDKSYISLCRRHFSYHQIRAALHDGVHPALAGHAHMARSIYSWLMMGVIH